MAVSAGAAKESSARIGGGFPIYREMTVIDLQTKQCIFCAETIQAAAVKCRFCGEFLNTDKARALAAKSESDSQSPEGEAANDDVLFAGRPSIFGMTAEKSTSTLPPS